MRKRLAGANYVSVVSLAAIGLLGLLTASCTDSRNPLARLAGRSPGPSATLETSARCSTLLACSVRGA